MALEALSTNELLNLIMCDSNIGPWDNGEMSMSQHPLEIGSCSSAPPPPPPPGLHQPALPETAASGRKKRRRRPKVCKNKEEAETQRMTHIAVERNRRKQMNEHLAVLRSLMPQSYVQRGDQASIVGGAIEFVKELEHILQSLEAKKFALAGGPNNGAGSDGKPESDSNPFARFFAFPQFTWSGGSSSGGASAEDKHRYCQTTAAVADIEVTLIETHANVRILARRGARRQLSRLVSGFHSVRLTVLHLNVTTLGSLGLYSVSAKVEEGCQLNSADEIAGAVHHMLKIMEEETLGLNF